MNASKILLAGLGLAWAAGAVSIAAASDEAERMPLAAQRSLVLDATESASRAVAVGERGHVLLSESRTEWRQAESVPTRATLTSVDAVGEKVWAVGHDGTILHSPDGGLSWTLQREETWTQEGFDSPDWTPRYAAPLLDVLFLDANVGYAVGAYSLMLRTDDAGATWRRVPLLRQTAIEGEEGEEAAAPAESDSEDAWTFDADELMLDEEEDPHLNAIARTPAGLFMIVAERGAAFRSRDDGETWERISLPYEGSMFGVLVLGDQHLLAYGLRGHVQETRDGGDTWELVRTGTELSLMGGAALPNGGAVIVGANGVVLHRADSESAFTLYTFENDSGETPVLSAVVPMGARTFLFTSDKGIARYEVPARDR
ncbi:WD40/YVTN/BNR-like repeat-containing protein [Pseudomarimonas salicorniae]|uniref:YCF48-related protein n=1 Tax=Pseudomarimonas salicorniae TaxID=2933270 RepID=A0ABT0GHL1_9GAMM|nr:YCF48-related protein [Lysobacter sp. CAU 1642]MCK7594031.1 YCF48-related protein [Lysobacter sp. CAU 1642]